MRAMTVGLVIACAVALQTSLAPYASIGPIRPDWPLAVAVFFALYAPRGYAVLVALLLGLAADMMSLERLGLLALTYAIAAAAVNLIREFVFLRNAVTHAVVTLFAGLLAQTLLTAYRIVALPASVEHLAAVAWDGACTALYTALWAPPLHFLLLRLANSLGIPSPRYTHERAGWFRRTRV